MYKIKYDVYEGGTRPLQHRVFPADRQSAMVKETQVKHGLKQILRSRYNVNVRVVKTDGTPVIFNHGPLIHREFCPESGILKKSDFGFVLEYTTIDNNHYTLPREPDYLYISITALEKAIIDKGLADLILDSSCKLAWYGEAGKFGINRKPVKLLKDDNLNIYYISESVTTKS